MNIIVAIFISIILSGCVAGNIRPQAKPYDNPKEGYVVYAPKPGYQQLDGAYLRGFYSKGMNYVTNCIATTSVTPKKNIQAYLRFIEDDGVVYLSYLGGPRFASCEINYDIIAAEVEQYIAKKKAIAQANAGKDVAAKYKPEDERKVEFGGYVATKGNVLGSVLLACYTGSLDSDGGLVSKEEQSDRYNELLGLYEGDSLNIKRLNNAFNFARRNLSDRYPLDTRGQYRADICDQMVMKGRL